MTKDQAREAWKNRVPIRLRNGYQQNVVVANASHDPTDLSFDNMVRSFTEFFGKPRFSKADPNCKHTKRAVERAANS